MANRLKRKPGEVALQNAAEEEIARFKGSPYLWCKHVLGVELDPHQIVYIESFSEHQNNLLIGSRRIRKSFAVAMWLLMEAATKPRAEINIHSPTLEQSKRDLKYMTDRVVDSEVLTAFVERRLGEGIGREYLEFANGSVIQAKGQASSTDGLGATHQWWEEVDDMDWETLLTRIFPTGSQIKPEFEYGDVRGCRRVATGTIKGKGNIHRLEHPEVGADASPVRFNVLPKLDAWFGIAAGIIPENDIVFARDTLMTPAQFARTYLCLYTESQEYFPSHAITACHDPTFVPVRPVVGETFGGMGPVTLGMDFEGQGATDEASSTAVVFVEQPLPGEYRWLWGREWAPGALPDDIKDEVVAACRYFRPESGYGDAYDANLIFEINEALFKSGVTRKRATRMNKAGAGGWDEWFFRPIRFHGRAKHDMYRRLQVKMLGRAVGWPVPVADHPLYEGLVKFVSQLENIKARQTREGYDSFSCIRPVLGDDLVDATVAAMWAQREVGAAGGACGGAARSGGFKGERRFAAPRFKGGRL